MINSQNKKLKRKKFRKFSGTWFGLIAGKIYSEVKGRQEARKTWPPLLLEKFSADG
jgi:hypothetical protein